MRIAYFLWYVPKGDEYKERAKLIGIYASVLDAHAAIKRQKMQPGFRNYTQGFEVDAYEVGKDH